MFKQLLRYTFLMMFIYLILVAAEIFLLKPLVDFFGNSFRNNLIVYSILILIIDPILVKIIGNRISFRNDKEEKEVL